MSDHYELLMTLIAEQAPALLLVDGVVYEGHVQSCLDGEVTVLARRHCTREARAERRWALSEIRDIGWLEDVPDEPEDPLLRQARTMIASAREDGRLSLAERLLVEHTTRREPDGS